MNQPKTYLIRYTMSRYDYKAGRLEALRVTAAQEADALEFAKAALEQAAWEKRRNTIAWTYRKGALIGTEFDEARKIRWRYTKLKITEY